jgi:hypothetical protein
VQGGMSIDMEILFPQELLFQRYCVVSGDMEENVTLECDARKAYKTLVREIRHRIKKMYIYMKVYYTHRVPQYMFRPLMWPFLVRCLTKDRYVHRDVTEGLETVDMHTARDILESVTIYFFLYFNQ